MEAANEPLLAPNRRDQSETPRLPTGLVAVMWGLGLIEWSQPVRGDPDWQVGYTAPLTAVRGKRKRRLLCGSSRIFLVILTALNVYSGCNYVRRFFGIANNFYHFASFLLTYWPLMISVQIICLFTTVRRWLHCSDYAPIDGQWWTVLSESSVLRRFRPFQFRPWVPPKVGYLVGFILLAVFNNSLIGINFYLNDKPEIHIPGYLKVHHVFELVTNVLSMFYFAIFCYFLYLQRIALEIHCSRVVWFIRKNAGQLAECQSRLNDCFKDYLSVRRLIHPWITLVISATTFGLAVHVAWNYKAIGEEIGESSDNPPTMTPFLSNLTNVNETSSISFNFYFLDALIFSNKLSVLLMALLAVGGTDISGIWKRLVFTIHLMRSSKYEKFWSKMTKLIRQLNMGTTADTVIEILLPVLLLALGILGVDKFDF